MARFFLTKVWGFDPEEQPALGFSSPGGRDKFLRESKAGDWVIFAGTMTAPTPPESRGRLLGMVQLGTQEIDVEALLHEIGVEIPAEDYLENGRYRWPYGLPVLQAKSFVDAPTLIEIFGDNLSGTEWAAYALDIEEKRGSEVRAKIEALRTEDVKVPNVPSIVRQRERQQVFELAGTAVTGPGPSTSRAGFERASGSAFVYLLELQGVPRSSRPIFKVGYASDVECRVVDLNKGLLPSITGYAWKLVSRQPFPNENQAFQFEQILHNRLRPHLVAGEREIYRVHGRADIDTVWSDILFSADWAVSEEQV